MAHELMDAARLAERHTREISLTVAERAAADRTWAYGHVIVDEAQELSEMAWRMLMRRCPSRSMTIVGDVAQTGDPAGSSSWRQALGPYVADRWRLERLTVNYRMPAEIMAVAAAVLAELDPSLEPPRSVRRSGVEPWRLAVPAGTLAERLRDVVAREAAAVGDGRLGVLVPAALLGELGDAVAGGHAVAVGEDPELVNRVTLLTVKQAKGLEFDSVIVVEPDRIRAESPRGLNDLYVALTRATQRLGLMYVDVLPGVLRRLGARDGTGAEPRLEASMLP